MCNFFIYGKIPSERKDFKINVVDIKSKSIKESSISKIMQSNKIRTDDIEEMIIMVAEDKFDVHQVDLRLSYQVINGVEIFKIHDYVNSKYDYFDDDVLIQDSIYTISLINEIISTNCKYFAVYINYKDSRKIKFKKINDTVVEDVL